MHSGFKRPSLFLFSEPYAHMLAMHSEGLSHNRHTSATFTVWHCCVDSVSIKNVPQSMFNHTCVTKPVDSSACVCASVCESWCTVKAARSLQQAEALSGSLIKQRSQGGRSVNRSSCRQSSWQNWSFVNSSSQSVRLCIPLLCFSLFFFPTQRNRCTQKAGLFLTSTGLNCLFLYNQTKHSFLLHDSAVSRNSSSKTPR